MHELVSTYGVHPTQIVKWKKHLQSELPHIFSNRRAKHEHDQAALHAQLYQQIGQLKVALDWLKKNLDWSSEAKRHVIEPPHPQISSARQCALLGVPRPSYDYPSPGERPEHVHLMRLLDAQYTETPSYGVRRLTAWLRRQGYAVHGKRGARLMRTRGLETLYPTPRTTPLHPAHRLYPYVLRDVAMTQVNQGWSTDITSIRLHSGCIYLTAVMDGFRRYVWSWAVSITMEVGFAWRPWNRHCGSLDRGFAIVIKGHGSPASTSQDAWKQRAYGSVWMGEVGRWTTCLANVCGAR